MILDRENTFNALVLREKNGKIFSAIENLDNKLLPNYDVTISVKYSTVNYKDGLIVNGLGDLVKIYPHVPGIDFCGVVEKSLSPDYSPGDQVVVTGWRVGDAHWGGYGTRARVKAEWLVQLPEGMSLLESMAIGTAGFSAMLAIMKLEELGLNAGIKGEVLVTGAGGGVGSIAVAILSELGYNVAASTGRKEVHDYLKRLGAASIIDRADLEVPFEGLLDSARWAGAIDNVGGTTLANVLGSLQNRASCSAVGLAASSKLNTTVIPFLLRGVSLLGIESSFSPKEERAMAWRRLNTDLPKEKLKFMTSMFGIEDIVKLSKKIIEGRVRGRAVINVNGR